MNSRRTLLLAAGLWSLVSATGASAVAGQPAGQPGLEEILSRYAKARGGAKVWHDMVTMGWTGTVRTPGGNTPDMSFLLLFQRPNMTRFELAGKGQRSLRIFDGSRGWKIRPGDEHKLKVDDYTAEELRAAKDAGGIDGPLINSAAKGIGVALDGADTVEGHKAWRLVVKLPSGEVQRHWLDATSYLELRYDRVSHDSSGRDAIVSVYLRDYQKIGGVTLPMTIETQSAPGQVSSQMSIEKVAINPVLALDTFSGPSVKTRHGGVLIDTTKPPPAAGGSPR